MSLFTMPQTSAYGQNVKPSDGAKLYFYDAGTTTLKTIYTDIGETVAHANPVVADASGRFDPIFLSGSYKTVLKDKNDVTIWTEDNLQSTTGSMRLLGDFDSSTNGGDYPSSGQSGDLYRVDAAFTLNAASGSHYLYAEDFIFANKANATAIDADWEIIKGRVWLIDEDSFATDSAVLAPSQQSTKVYIASQILDEDDFVSDSATKAPSQQSTKKFIEDGTTTFANKTMDSASNTITIDSSEATLTIDSSDNPDITLDDGNADTRIERPSTTRAGAVYPAKRIVLSNGTDADHDIDFTTGRFIFSDYSGEAFIASALVKQLDATWAAGDAAGGRAAGVSLSNTTTYHCFGLSNSSGSVTDIGFDTSVTAANLIADAAVISALGASAKYKILGSVLTDGSANIKPFIQNEKRFRLLTRTESSSTLVGGATTAITLLGDTPVGRQTLGQYIFLMTDNVNNAILLTSFDEADVAATTTNCDARMPSGSEWVSIKSDIVTNTSAQIRGRQSDASLDDFEMITRGWVDFEID